MKSKWTIRHSNRMARMFAAILGTGEGTRIRQVIGSCPLSPLWHSRPGGETRLDAKARDGGPRVWMPAGHPEVRTAARHPICGKGASCLTHKRRFELFAIGKFANNSRTKRKSGPHIRTNQSLSTATLGRFPVVLRTDLFRFSSRSGPASGFWLAFGMVRSKTTA